MSRSICDELEPTEKTPVVTDTPEFEGEFTELESDIEDGIEYEDLELGPEAFDIEYADVNFELDKKNTDFLLTIMSRILEVLTENHYLIKEKFQDLKKICQRKPVKVVKTSKVKVAAKKPKKTLKDLIVEEGPVPTKKKKKKTPGRPTKTAPRIRVPQKDKPKNSKASKASNTKASVKVVSKVKAKGKSKKTHNVKK